MPALLTRCDQILAQLCELPSYATWMKRRDELRAQYRAAAEAVPRDHTACGKIGVALGKHMQLQEKLVVTDVEAATLRQRHDEVVKEVAKRCDELVAAGATTPLQLVATKLQLLHAVDLSCLPVPAPEASGPAECVLTTSAGTAAAGTAAAGTAAACTATAAAAADPAPSLEAVVSAPDPTKGVVAAVAALDGSSGDGWDTDL